MVRICSEEKEGLIHREVSLLKNRVDIMAMAIIFPAKVPKLMPATPKNLQPNHGDGCGQKLFFVQPTK